MRRPLGPDSLVAKDPPPNQVLYIHVLFLKQKYQNSKIVKIWTKFSSNIVRKKMADHSLEMSGLG